jgi:hypothetical protein
LIVTRFRGEAIPTERKADYPDSRQLHTFPLVTLH